MKLTPAMEQFMRIKNEHPDCILLFRMGDFYETFFDDAKVVSRDLNIVLTSRGKDKVPLAGIPFHSIEPYINKLVSKGHRVAIVEQLEDPKKAKGIVRRGLVKIVTPGTLLDEKALDEKNNNYLACVSFGDGFGISYIDLSTGDFYTTDLEEGDEMIAEIKKILPSEIIVPSMHEKEKILKRLDGFFINSLNDVFFYHENAYDNLLKHFRINNLRGFDIENKKLCISSCGAIISYLLQTQKSTLANISKIRYFKTLDHMYLDSTSIRNLELFKNIFDGKVRGSLIDVLDMTMTPMGSRKLKNWILRPLIDREEIEERYDAVQEMGKIRGIRDELKGCLDMPRLLSRIVNGHDNPKDIQGLRNTLKMIPYVMERIADKKSLLLKRLFEHDISHVTDFLDKTICDDPPSHTREGNVIREGYDEKLDEIRKISKDAKRFILDMESEERKNTGIKSLKIRYNKVFGYFIEVTKANLSLVPGHYIRKQTQVNAERFITQELKEKEDMILNSVEKMIEREKELYSEIVSYIEKSSKDIMQTADDLAVVDVISSFSTAAKKYSYSRPKLTEGFDITIDQGRHPVIERFEDVFIPNDTKMDKDNRMMIITGPNMSGKSSYMRQVALIVLMAQAGCFVPAKKALISIVDRIFTRIGAFDDISSGQSTFMMEMNETSNIVNNATEKSLIVLDEIGRGTSTFDGISLAWAISEYIIKNVRAKTMFATHYHQLNRLSENHKEITNYHVKVLEEKSKIVFLHKIEKGGTDKSYGVEVAKLAGLPDELISSAKKIMKRLEMEDQISERISKSKKSLSQESLSTFIR